MRRLCVDFFASIELTFMYPSFGVGVDLEASPRPRTARRTVRRRVGAGAGLWRVRYCDEAVDGGADDRVIGQRYGIGGNNSQWNGCTFTDLMGLYCPLN